MHGFGSYSLDDRDGGRIAVHGKQEGAGPAELPAELLKRFRDIIVAV